MGIGLFQLDRYGLAPAEANYVRPGKKPLSSMSPMIVLEDGEEGAQRLKMVVGASGGPMIITAVVQVSCSPLLSLSLSFALKSPNVPQLTHCVCVCVATGVPECL